MTRRRLAVKRHLLIGAFLSWLLGIPGLPGLPELIAAEPSPASSQPGQSFPDLGNLHIKQLGDSHLPYNSDPPTSGPHMPGIAPWGAYDQPIPKEYQVHNLEDGGVVIQYHCPKGCPELVKKLEGVFFKYRARAAKEHKYQHLILAPYPGMKTRIALTAWTRLNQFHDFDEARIDRFIEAYVGIDHHSKQ